MVGVGARRCPGAAKRRYDDAMTMTSSLRVLVEQPTKGKRWVAVAADWPGLERGGKTEDEALEKIARYVPRYLTVAKRSGLDGELASQTEAEIIGRYPGTGSTDFWGISFAPSPLDREPFDAIVFDRNVGLLRAAWAEFDETATRVSPELRPGVRGGGRARDEIVGHVFRVEGLDFSKRSACRSRKRKCVPQAALPPTETTSWMRCATGTRPASHSGSGRSHTCSATPRTTCWTMPGRCRTGTCPDPPIPTRVGRHQGPIRRPG